MQETVTPGLLNLKRMETPKSLGPADGQPSSRFRERCCLSWIRCRVIDQSTQPPLPVSVHGGYTKCMHTCMHRTHICVCTGHTHVCTEHTHTRVYTEHTHMYTLEYRNKEEDGYWVFAWRLLFCCPLKSFFSLRVALCSFRACPETCSLGQAGLELTEIRIPLPPKCWD